MMETKKDTATFVREARAKLGLSQDNFGLLIGRRRRSILRYEQGWPVPLEVQLAIKHLLSKRK